MWMPRWSRNGRTGRASGGQITWAVPISPTSTPTPATSVIPTGAPASLRITNRSTTSPNSGAHPPTTISSASHCGKPRFSASSQYRNAMTMPIAPCPTLNTLEVL
jgi:hypothetical protein